MNKKLYRIVFNKARGLLMAVAETAGCAGGVGSSGSSMDAAALVVPPVPVAKLRMIAFAALIAAGGQIMMLPLAGAQIVANPSAPINQQPVIVNTATGIPQVNIQTPSAAGVSRNTYTQFDVQAQGAILNNSRSDVQTQTGGWVQRNPNLAAGTARIILNEVNSSNPSYLRGYLEVAGDSAQVVIANPAGVSCSGCGFVNANRVTLTTGTPIMNGGSLDGYVVRHGTVSINGAGMDSGGAAYTDIIARAVQINAGLWGKTLKVTAGANQVNADNTQATAIAGDGAVPAFGIDVAQLGGMYANHIFLVGTEAGVGMRNAGAIGAAAGEFTVTTNGQLINSGQINSVGATRIAASALDNSGGKIQATGDVDIDVAGGTVNNTAGLVASGGALSLKAASLINANTDGADQGVHGSSVAITADNIDNRSGQLIADQGMSLIGSGAIDNTGGAISSGLALRIADRNAGTAAAKTLLITNTNGSIVAGDSAAIDSASLSGDGTVKSETDLSVKLNSDFTNTGALQSNTSLTFETTGALINQGALKALNNVSVTAASIDNRAAGEIAAAILHLAATDVHTMTNRGLINGTDTFIDTPTFNNIGTGRVYGDHVAIGVTTLNNIAETVNGVTSAPVIAARIRLDIGAQTINNQEHGLITSQGDMAIGATLDASHQATGQADTVNNNSATIEAMGAMDLNAKNVNNTNEHLSTHEVLISSTAMQEYQLSGSGTRWRPDQIQVVTDEVSQLNTPDGWGYIFTLYDFVRTVMETQILSTDPAKITAGLGMRINADSVNNAASIIQAGGALTGTIGQLVNTELPGHRTTTDAGTAYGYYDIERSGRDAQGLTTAGYAPAASVAAISLTPTLYQQNATVAPTGTQIAALSTARLNSIVSIPNNSLFSVNTDPGLHYLIQSDPNFTNYKSWLSSDYMLNKLNIDPSLTQKRLGDGYYEQKLVRDQVAELTGKRFLDNYTSDEAQYQALMDAGVTYAQQWNLPVGVGLTPAQMAQLTSDIVLLVQKDVTLPSGEVTQVLVPQVYVRLQDGDINGSGALLAGNSTNLAVTGDITNSGTIAGRTTLAMTAENVQNLGGRITGAAVTVQANNDINNLGGTIDAKDSLGVAAGHDLNIVSTTTTSESEQGSRTNIDRVAALYVANANSTLVATAGNDVNINAGQIANSGASGTTTIAAGNNLNIGTVTESNNQAIAWNGSNYRKDSATQETGSSISAVGNINLLAGNDLNAKAAVVASDQGAIVATAAHDVNITAGTNTQTVDEGHQSSGSSGMFSSKTRTTRDQLDLVQSSGSTLSSNTVAITAGNDANVVGSNVVSTAGTSIGAGNNVNIIAATDTRKETHLHDEVTSGLFSGGGLGVTIGTQEQANNAHQVSASSVASNIGSTDGDVNIVAGKQYQQTGSQILAPTGDVNILAQSVAITASQNTERDTQESVFKQSGLSISITNPIVSAVQQIQQMKSASEKTTDSRMKGLAAAASALTVANTADAVASTAAPAGGIDLAFSIGASENKSTSIQNSNTAQGSSIAAGGNITIAAVGGGTDSNLTIQGSDIAAGNNVTLHADNQVNLLAAQNTSDQHSENSGYSASIGFSIGTSGLMFNLGLSGSRGRGDGNDVTYTNSHVDAGNNLAISSGTDTNIIGAVASGKQVDVDVGTSGTGNLNIASLQDTSTYKSNQESLGGSISVGIGRMSGSISVSKSTVDGSYASVNEQSGITAGDGGFNVHVAGNTDLAGGKIASTDKAVQDNKNSLTTGTLTQSDIANHSDYEASSMSISVGGGYSGSTASMNGTGIGFGNKSGSDSSTTINGISSGTVVINDAAGQLAKTGKTVEQTIASINTGVSTDKDTSGHLTKGWDGQQLMDDVTAQAQITAAFGKEANKGIGTYATSQLVSLKAKAALADDPTEKAALLAEAAKWDEGGTYRVALQAATGALSGGIGGALGAAASAEAMPTISKAIEAMDLPDAVKLGLDQIAAAALGAAVGGTAGLASSVSVEANNRELHKVDRTNAKTLVAIAKAKGKFSDLSEQDFLNALQVAGVVDVLGRVIVNPNTRETYVNGVPLDNGSATLNLDQNQLQNAPFAVNGDATTKVEILPNVQLTPELVAFIKEQMPEYIFDMGPTVINTPVATPTAQCAVTAANCAAGLPPAMTQEQFDARRTGVADLANALATFAGRFSSSATAYGTFLASQPNAASQTGAAIQFGFAGIGTIVGFGASGVEQIFRPDVGQTWIEGPIGATAAVLGESYPLAGPAINELANKSSQTNFAENLKNTINIWANYFKQR